MKYIYLLSCLWHLVTGSLKVISMKSQSAAVGLSVTLQCQLITSTKPEVPDVLQVSWEKESGSNIGPVATYSKSFGKRYIGYYSNRIADFTDKTPNASAITIQSVNLEDHGCFKCTFNVFPYGATYANICLDVYEMNISEPTLDSRTLTPSNSSEEIYIISCSVTGKPAPRMWWNISESMDGIPYNYTIVNPDQSVTVISNFTHTVSKLQHERKVTCVINHPALQQTIYLTKSINYTGKENPNPNLDRTPAWMYIVVAAAVVAIVILITYFICRGCTRKSKYEGIQRCQKSHNIKPRESNGSTYSKEPILKHAV
uniref:Ig-like domain-containing protein n=1 Tax=Leptobrachium leishanense TaxID=445787 RepID=A0A8C5P7C3_9ANUR